MSCKKIHAMYEVKEEAQKEAQRKTDGGFKKTKEKTVKRRPGKQF